MKAATLTMPQRQSRCCTSGRLELKSSFIPSGHCCCGLLGKKRFNLLAITIAVTIISFVLNIGKVSSDAVAAFYSPQTRFWELMAGSILAYMTLHKQHMFFRFKRWLDICLGSYGVYAQTSEANDKTLHNVQSVIGAVLITIGVFVITKEMRFPGWWAVLPTFGAVLIISAGTQAWLNRVVLSNRVLVWFGLISFPLYLWHWPLLSFARILTSEVPSREVRVGMVVLSIMLAWLTYQFIERPVKLGPKKYLYSIVFGVNGNQCWGSGILHVSSRWT
jgi:peptidoglycan/LPS O-acetylase OafA/YrhL